MAQENLAITGDLESAPFLVKKLDAQSVFELADRLGDGGLADMEHLGGLANRALACGLEKGRRWRKRTSDAATRDDYSYGFRLC